MILNKKISLVFSLIVFLLSAVFSYFVFSKDSQETIISPLAKYTIPKLNGNNNHKNDAAVAKDEPKTEECPLTGEMLTKTQREKWEKRRPLGVMIENHPQARPQSGLSSADIIYEVVAEGGITRFLAIYYCKDASYIGPIRSARIYFIKLLQEYGEYPLYAHVGGANTPGPADALGYIRDIDWNMYNDLNQFAVPFPYYWRDYERLPDRATEHTVYSSTAKLWQYAKEKRNLTNVDEKGVSWDKDFVKWKFKDDAKTEERGEIAKISFGFWDMSASDFSVVWHYDKVRNTYKRDNGGSPHIDKNTGKALETKNVIILFMDESPANDGYEGGHLLYKVTGTGDALVFQDGKVIPAFWNKKDVKTRLKLTETKTGKEIPIVRGQVFIEVLPTGNKVVY